MRVKNWTGMMLTVELDTLDDEGRRDSFTLAAEGDGSISRELTDDEYKSGQIQRLKRRGNIRDHREPVGSGGRRRGRFASPEPAATPAANPRPSAKKEEE